MRHLAKNTTPSLNTSHTKRNSKKGKQTRRSTKRHMRVEVLERRELFSCNPITGSGCGQPVVKAPSIPTPIQVAECIGDLVKCGEEVGKQASDAVKDRVQHITNEVDNGAEWFRDRRDELKDAAIKVRDEVNTAWDEAESAAKQVLNEAQQELTKTLDAAEATAKSAWNEVEKQSDAAVKTIEAQAKKLETSWDVVTDVLAQAEQVARSAGKQAEEFARDALDDAKPVVDGLINQIKKPVLYDHTTPGSLTFNMKEGTIFGDVDFANGVEYDSEKIKAAIDGRLSLPDVNYLEVAMQDSSGVSDNYQSVRASFYEQYGAENVYFSTHRFTTWASPESVVDGAVKTYFGQGETVIQDAVDMLELEYQDILSWLEFKAEDEAISQATHLLESLIFQQDFESPHLAVKWSQVDYHYSSKTVLGEASVDSPHLAFAIIWKGPESQTDINGALNKFDEVHLKSESQNLLKEIAESKDLPGKNELFDALLDRLASGGTASQDVEQQRAQQLSEILGIDEAELRAVFQEGNPIIDLRHTKVADNIDGFLDNFAFGNEGSVSIDVFEFRLTDYTLDLQFSLRHRHIWNLEKVLPGFSLTSSERGTSVEYDANSTPNTSESSTSVVQFDNAAGEVIVDGSDGADVIRAHVDGDSLVVVVSNDEQIDVRTFALAKVTRITINGRSGDDVLTNDTNVASIIRGGDGHDVISGGAGADTLEGDSGNDRINGNAGNDIIRGGGGNDHLSGNAGNDQLHGDAGHDRLHGHAGDDQLRGGPAHDVLFGDEGNDWLHGDDGLDQLFGGANNDRLEGGRDHDKLSGGAGNDRLLGNFGDDRLAGGSGNDKLEGHDGNDTLIGGSGHDQLYGGNQDDRLLGKSGNDELHGGNGNDYMHGSTGEDKLYGGNGNDTMKGGSGNDHLSGGNGNDSLYGYKGKDKLKGDAGHDRLSGHKGDDVLYGGSGHDKVYGGSGNDKLYGGNGNDFLHGSYGHDTIKGGRHNDTIKGGSGNDWIDGESGHDRIYGYKGHDTIYGGSGNDYVSGFTGNDYLHGGSGNDTVKGGSGHDRLYGGSGNDTIRGHSGNDKIDGGSGKDDLRGGSGNDKLFGGSGRDWLFGNDGHDKLYGQSGADYLSGGHGNDTLDGGNHNDRLEGGSGNDRLYGRSGDDRLNGGSGNDVIYGHSGRDTLKGGSGNDYMHGGDDVDMLYGENGSDKLYGGQGRDYLHGGRGNDKLAGKWDWLWRRLRWRYRGSIWK